MNYSEFTELIINQLQEKMGEDYSVLVHKVKKNNGIELDGLVMLRCEENISPTLYLNSYFQQLESGMSIDEILNDICYIYKNSEESIPQFLANVSDYESIKETIVYKLIRRQGNEELLSEIPFMPFLDLAIVYYLLLDVNEQGEITALIHNNHLRLWHVEQETLHNAAVVNTVKRLPASFQPIWKLMSEIVNKSIENENVATALCEQLKEGEETIKHPLFVLSNNIGVQGAACILYEEVLKNISQKWDKDIIILPSSVHETILLPYAEDTELGDLQTMVKSINDSMVNEEDVLSDHVYLFNRRDNDIYIAK